jgi:hypothetical protein
MDGIRGVTFQPKPFGPIAVVGDTGQLVCILAVLESADQRVNAPPAPVLRLAPKPDRRKRACRTPGAQSRRKHQPGGQA